MAQRVRQTRRVKPTPGFLIGCGVDVVELARFRRAVGRGRKRFLRRIFTDHETAYARARRRTMMQHLAGRFAAKEAAIKAISQVDPERAFSMNQVEVRNDRLGRPYIVLHGRHARGITVHVSLSHVESVAIASAIAIG